MAPLGLPPRGEGNGTWDQFLIFTWLGKAGEKLLVAVNYGPAQGQ